MDDVRTAFRVATQHSDKKKKKNIVSALDATHAKSIRC